MITYLKDEPTTIQWLDETCEAIMEALKAAGVEALRVERFPGLTKPEECGQGSFWKRERPGQEYERMVLWIITGEHVQIVGSSINDNDCPLPSVTVGVLNYAAPMKDGWARFQEYRHTASAGKRGIRIATVVERFQGYHELVIDPSKANSTKKPKPGVRENDSSGSSHDDQETVGVATPVAQAQPAASADEPQPKPVVQEPAKASKPSTTPVESPPQLEMAPAPAGKFYVHIPMMVVSQPFALALEALVRGANGEINMTSTQQ